MEYSYLRAADKKHGVPEHMEKTVLFLVDASPIATAGSDAQDWDAKASSAKEAEEEAGAAVKAAWHAAKEAREVSRQLVVFLALDPCTICEFRVQTPVNHGFH